MNADRERVLILHGFAAPGFVMLPLRYWLRRNEFDAQLWCYPNLRVPVPDLAKRLAHKLDHLDLEGFPYHIVTHSMGSIVTRAALLLSRHTYLKRMVFLAPPITGTPLGRLAPTFLKRLFPPISDLSDAKDSFVNSLPMSLPVETGIVAARFDLLVPLENTIMSEKYPRRVVMGSHNSILFSQGVAKSVASFLRHGRF